MLMLMLMLMFMFMFIMFMLWHVHVLRYYSPSQPNTLWRYPPRRNTLWRYPPFSDDVFYLSLKKPILPKGRIQGSKVAAGNPHAQGHRFCTPRAGPP